MRLLVEVGICDVWSLRLSTIKLKSANTADGVEILVDVSMQVPMQRRRLPKSSISCLEGSEFCLLELPSLAEQHVPLAELDVTLRQLNHVL
jgi:hypothetical protein